MYGAKREDGGARERRQEVPSHPLFLWVTMLSPASGCPTVTPTPLLHPGWAVAVHPGWWKGAGGGTGGGRGFVHGVCPGDVGQEGWMALGELSGLF